MTDSPYRPLGDIEFHHAGEWIAVYLDGKLERVGDAYLADEWLQERAGVVSVYDNAFMRGGNGREGVGQTLDMVAAYRDHRDNLKAQAQALRDEAAALEARAAALDSEQ